MNITENLIRIKEGKDNIIKSLKNKGVSIDDNTLINEIPTIIDNAEIGGGGDTPSQPDVPELVQKYEGASVFRIEVPNDNYEFAINLCNNATTATYDVDWGDGVLESGLTTNEQHHTYSKAGTYDVNIYNISKNITLGGVITLSKYDFSTSVYGDNSRTLYYYYLFNNTNNDIYIRDGKGIGFNTENICTNILIGDKINYIGSNCFTQYTSLQSIVIPEGVTSIGDSCFRECTSLQSIVIPDTVTSIGNSCFERCYSLQSIVIPDTVTSIGKNCFQYCYSLQYIELPNTLTSLGSMCFSQCTSLQSIVIPEGVTSIGSGSFQQCASLQSIVIPEGVMSIDSDCFYDCVLLQSIVIPDTVTSIGNSCFRECTSLQSIVIPEGVTRIGNTCFEKCYLLQSIVIPDTVTSIGSSCFKQCYSLQSIVIPDTVTSIGNSCFEECTSLQSIVIPEGVTSVADYCFLSCFQLQNITFGEKITNIGNTCFQQCYNLNTIICLNPTAPTITSSTFNLQTKASKNILYIPENSVGYDEGYWGSQLIETNKFQIKSINEKPIEKQPCVFKYITSDSKKINTLDYLGSAKLIDIQKNNDEYTLFYDDSIYTISKTDFQNNKKLVSIELPETINYLVENTFNYCTFLNSITCNALTAPKIYSNTFNSIGTNVPSGTPKVLRVPEGAVGYDEGYWKSTVLDKGYTLEYVPLSEL